MEIKKTLGGMFDAMKKAAEVAAPIMNPVGTAVAKVVADQFHPAPAGPVTPPSPPPPADRLASSGLGTEQKAKLQAALDGKSGAPAKVVAEAALAQASTLPQEQATKLLNVASMNPAGPEGAALTKIFTSPTWLASTPEQKGQLLNVASTASPKGLEALSTLAQNNKLTTTDAKGGTLLSNLSKMSTQELGSDLKNLPAADGSPTRQSLLDGVLMETADPGLNVRQSTMNTCTATTAQYELATRQPAEYARLMVGLTGTDGKVAMAGGKLLKLDDEGISRTDSTDKRSDSSRLFQNAAMEFANGADNFNGPKDKTFTVNRNGEDTGKGRIGLKEDEEVALNRELFNEPRMNWYSTKGRENDFVEALKNNDHSKPIVLNMDIGRDVGVQKTGHAVSFVKVENGRVYFRNPDANASLKSNVPGARVEDPAQGIDSMSVEDFKKRCNNISAVVG